MKTTDTAFPAALEAAALSWVGTPFRLLGAEKGVCTDCSNVVFSTLSEAGIELPDLGAPTFGQSSDTPYLDTAIRAALETLVTQGHLIAVADITAPLLEPGDLLLVRLTRRTKHLALAVDARRVLHAYPNSGAQIVAWDARWKSRLTDHYRLTNE